VSKPKRVPKALVVQLYGIVPPERNYAASTCDCVPHRFGHAADHPDRARAYPTDLTDPEWAEMAPLIPTPAWILGHGGRPEEYCHRQLIDSMLYLTDNGIKWRAMPADFPAWDDCYRFFRRWKTQGLLTVVHARLRRACREQAGRAPEPTAAIIDSQSLRAAETVGDAQRGYDGANYPGCRVMRGVGCFCCSGGWLAGVFRGSRGRSAGCRRADSGWLAGGWAWCGPVLVP
jgi:transposase